MQMSGQLHSLDKNFGPHWIRGWVGPRTGLGAVMEENIPSLHLLVIEPLSSSP
jgi:hypothetical protein